MIKKINVEMIKIHLVMYLKKMKGKRKRENKSELERKKDRRSEINKIYLHIHMF